MSKAFQRSKRLLKASEYSHVFAKADKISDGFWTLIVRPNDVGYARLGLAIAKKALPRAVDRNRMKRIARESFRQSHDLMPAVDIVVLTRRGSAKQENADLFLSLQKCWAKL